MCFEIKAKKSFNGVTWTDQTIFMPTEYDNYLEARLVFEAIKDEDRFADSIVSIVDKDYDNVVVASFRGKTVRISNGEIRLTGTESEGFAVL